MSATRREGSAEWIIQVHPESSGREEPLDFSPPGSVGVATGIVWCGVIGNLKRKEYTVLGDVVNLSARMMANAGPMGILCDVETMRRGGLVFTQDIL